MAITVTKSPALFSHCTSAQIFEFTTDAEVGNFDDYVCDVFIRSNYNDKTAVIRNVFPNTVTKVFSVDVSEFLKALQLNAFEFDFNAAAKSNAVESFQIELAIRDGSQPASELQSFNDYYFDNLIFTDGLDSIDTETVSNYSILGERLLLDKGENALAADKLTFLAADTIEVCKDFADGVSIFQNEMTGQNIGTTYVIENLPNTKGVVTHIFTELQKADINSLTEIICTNQYPDKKLFAFPFKAADPCDKVVQFRYYNPRGGFSYFYAVASEDTSDRSKSTFYERSYTNEHEHKSPAVQASTESRTVLQFKGSKIAALKETFGHLLRSPKIEMNLSQINGNGFFVECEISGSSADRYTHFDFNIMATFKNSDTFRL